ncbi:MAG: chemotaxis protein CheW [Calditrichota bacterium]
MSEDIVEPVEFELPELEPEGDLIIVGRIRGVLVGLPVKFVKGVDRVNQATSLPETPGFITGLIYFRGGIEAAVDLGVILGGDKFTRSDKSRAVLTEAEGLRGAVIFDELLDMSFITSEMVKSVEVFDIPAEPIAGRFQWRDEAGLMIAPAGLFNYIANFANIG